MKIPNNNKIFPFGAIVGQDRMKLALLLSAINPAIGGILLIGDRGTGKTTAVKALHNLLCTLLTSRDGRPDLPGEYILGCPSPEIEGPDGGPVREGPPMAEATPSVSLEELKGRLRSLAGRGVLFVRGVERMDPRSAETILEAATEDNPGYEHGLSPSSRLIMIAAADSVPPPALRKFCEGFGLCVTTDRIEDQDERLRVLQYREDFDRDPAGFLKKFEPDQALVRDRISRAAEILQRVAVPESIVRHIADFGSAAGMKGHGAEIATLRTARTIAAFDGRGEVREDDARAAVELTMPHRMWDEILGSGAGSRAAGDRLQALWNNSGRGDSRFKTSAPAAEEPRRTRKKSVQAMKPAKECGPETSTEDSSRLLILVADTSGQNATARSAAVRDAVPEIIDALPGPRDRLALITVRGQASVLALPPGRDRAAAVKKCRLLQSGGKTPLPDGLLKALALARDEIRSDPSVHPLLAILSDGKANVSKGKNVMLDVEEAAAAIAKNGFPTLVIDPEGMGTRVGMATSLAQKMRATYHALEAPDAAEIVTAIKENLFE